MSLQLQSQWHSFVRGRKTSPAPPNPFQGVEAGFPELPLWSRQPNSGCLPSQRNRFSLGTFSGASLECHMTAYECFLI